jgi:Ca2+-binding EF-hand superfamily protein
MLVNWDFLESLHLTDNGLLNARSLLIVLEMFNTIDWRRDGFLDDIQFGCILSYATNLQKHEISSIFELFDLDASGRIEFDEFYLLVCILIAAKDDKLKLFMCTLI